MPNSDRHQGAGDRPFVFVLGASDPVVSTVVEAIESCLRDLESRLADVGCVLDDVVNVRAYLPSSETTIAGYAEYNQVYNQFFSDRGIFQKPARTSVGIDPLQRLEVKMEAFALRPLGRQASTADAAAASRA